MSIRDALWCLLATLFLMIFAHVASTYRESAIENNITCEIKLK